MKPRFQIEVKVDTRIDLAALVRAIALLVWLLT